MQIILAHAATKGSNDHKTYYDGMLVHSILLILQMCILILWWQKNILYGTSQQGKAFAHLVKKDVLLLFL